MSREINPGKLRVRPNRGEKSIVCSRKGGMVALEISEAEFGRPLNRCPCRKKEGRFV